jgi:hypothetical protein
MIEKLFLSVGAMKAGTTWLYDKLRQHPGVHFCPQKEVHFLAHHYGHSNILAPEKRKRRAAKAMRKARASLAGPELRQLRKWYQTYQSGEIDWAWFEEIMDAPRAKDRFLADFSNLNCFLTPDDWRELVSNRAEELRVIYIMRDPVERVWSHFKYHLQFSKHPAAKQPDKDFRLFCDLLSKPWFWRNACYAQTVRSLRSGLGEKQLRLFYFEDMVEDPQPFLDAVCRFIGLDSVKCQGDLGKRKNASIATPFPLEWEVHARSLLAGELASLRCEGIWHEKWSGN